MGDVFIERMIKKKFESTDMLILVGIIVAMVVFSVRRVRGGMLIIRMPMITLLVAMGAGFGGYKLLTMRLLSTNTA